MEKEFVPYQQALELKELGFDEPCLMYYTDNGELYKSNLYGISAPLYQQVFRWFREKYNAHIYPQKFTENTWHVSWGDWESPVFETYEEAELECVNFLITTLK
jgi:hypothetical protein